MTIEATIFFSYNSGRNPASIATFLNGGGTILSVCRCPSRSAGRDLVPQGDGEGRSGNLSQGDARYKFTSKERDTETGYDWLDVRGYDSRIGRFMTIDPLGGKHSGWSPYHYSYNNPLRFSDPTGLEGHENAEEEKKKREEDHGGFFSFFAKLLSVLGSTSEKIGVQQASEDHDQSTQTPVSAEVQAGINVVEKAGEIAQTNIQTGTDQLANVADATQMSADMLTHVALVTPGLQEAAPVTVAISSTAGFVKLTAQGVHVLAGGHQHTAGDLTVTAIDIVTGGVIDHATKNKVSRVLLNDLYKAMTGNPGHAPLH